MPTAGADERVLVVVTAGKSAMTLALVRTAATTIAKGKRPLLLVGYREHRVLIVNDKDRENLGGLCLARVCTDTMMVAGQFRRILAGAICFFRSVVDLAADLSLDDQGNRI